MSPRRGFPALGFLGAFLLALAGGVARAAPPTAPPASGLLDYRIGAGDVLQLFVWKEPDLSREITVRVDGKVTIPLLGDVEAAGRAPQELGEEISRSLSRFLAAPQVTLGVTQANSARFHVIGQVTHPGDFPLARPTTVLQALAIAGGFKEFAKTESILVIRHDGEAEVAVTFNYKHVEGGKDLTQIVLLRPGDTIIVP